MEEKLNLLNKYFSYNFFTTIYLNHCNLKNITNKYYWCGIPGYLGRMNLKKECDNKQIRHSFLNFEKENCQNYYLLYKKLYEEGYGIFYILNEHNYTEYSTIIPFEEAYENKNILNLKFYYFVDIE